MQFNDWQHLFERAAVPMIQGTEMFVLWGSGAAAELCEALA